MGTAPRTTFALERGNWRWWCATGLLRLPGRVRVRSYARRADAEKACRDGEAAVRARANPFLCGGVALRCQTSLTPGLLHDWALDLGLTPPGASATSGQWADWWRQEQQALSSVQRARMWDALDQLRFYEVVERPVVPVVYVVVAINWELNGEWSAEAEGGYPSMVFFDRAAAEQSCREGNDQARWHWEEQAAFEYQPQFSLRYRAQALEGLEGALRQCEDQEGLLDCADTPFYEVVEVEGGANAGGAPTKARHLQVVVRHGWRLLDRNGPFAAHLEEDVGAPVRAFASRAAAERHARKLTAEARDEVSPFRLGTNGLEELTSLSLDHLRARLAEIGVGRLPRSGSLPLWAPWWEEAARSLSEGQREAVWALLDRLHLYDVIAVAVMR